MKTYIKPETNVIITELCLPIALSGVAGTADMDTNISAGTTDTYFGRNSGDFWDDED